MCHCPVGYLHNVQLLDTAPHQDMPWLDAAALCEMLLVQPTASLHKECV